MSFNSSYTPHYLSIEDILATNERVSCKITNELPKMGFLDASSDNVNLTVGTTVELPFWLAETLTSRRPPMAAVDVPKVYKEAYREILKADASVVDLHKLGMFYYDFGCYLASFDPKGEVGNSLVSTFRSRFRHIMDLSQNSEPDPIASARLERLERSLLGAGQRSGGVMDSWCRRSTEPLRPSSSLTEHLKRKRESTEKN